MSYLALWTHSLAEFVQTRGRIVSLLGCFSSCSEFGFS